MKVTLFFGSLMATHAMAIVSVRYRADLIMPMLAALHGAFASKPKPSTPGGFGLPGLRCQKNLTTEMTMIRNRGLRLLALMVSLFTLPPIVLSPAFFGLAMPLAVYVGFVIWALLTHLIGSIFIAVWGTPQRQYQCHPDRIIEPACAVRAA